MMTSEINIKVENIEERRIISHRHGNGVILLTMRVEVQVDGIWTAGTEAGGTVIEYVDEKTEHLDTQAAILDKQYCLHRFVCIYVVSSSILSKRHGIHGLTTGD